MHANPLPPTSQLSCDEASYSAIAVLGPNDPASEQPSGDPTILIVDDDAALRGTVAMMLESHGFRTLLASNGLEALQVLEQNPQVQAVLLDLHMPVMDGEETFRQMRNFRGGIPVILISGFELGSVANRLGESLPDGYVQKPFSLARLTGVVTQLLHSSLPPRS